ncbi:MAG TPA: hypothetical protein VJA94_04090 [Candidatus Angelobacter sp.]
MDPPQAKHRRLPEVMLGTVKERIRKLLIAQKATVLVSSAACGADLLALEAAGELRLRRHVVLPFPRHVFKKVSVVDRPGDWGERYDQIIDEVQRDGKVLELNYSEDDQTAYSATNIAVLSEATRIAGEMNEPVSAVVVWDRKSRGQDDYTEQFQKHARERHLLVTEVQTIE